MAGDAFNFKNDAKILQGSTYRRMFTFWTGLTDAESAAIQAGGPGNDDKRWDFTGFTARMPIRNAVGGTIQVGEPTTENGQIEMGIGTITLYLTDEQTYAMPHGNHNYQLYSISPDGEAIRHLQGTFIVDRAVDKVIDA